MKNFLLTLTSIFAINTLATTVLTSQSVSNLSLTKEIEKNLNKVLYQPEEEYFYSYEIYINHRFVDAWDFVYTSHSTTAFYVAVSGNLVNFQSNITLSFQVVSQLTNSLHQQWNKSQITSYDKNDGIIVKFEYERFSLQNTTVRSQ